MPCDWQAYVKQVRKYQEEVERVRKKEQEERKKKQQQDRRKRRMLEAAFDGDNDAIMMLLKEVSEIARRVFSFIFCHSRSSIILVVCLHSIFIPNNWPLVQLKEEDDNDGVRFDDIGRAIRNKHELMLIDCEDANRNTPLSEAASERQTLGLPLPFPS